MIRPSVVNKNIHAACEKSVKFTIVIQHGIEHYYPVYLSIGLIAGIRQLFMALANHEKGAVTNR